MSVETKVNKSKIARQILSDIGALSENPPEGWRAKVEEELGKQGIKMHKVSLYQIRSKALKGKAAKKAARKQSVNQAVKKANPNDNSSVSFDDIQVVRGLLEKHGGEQLLQIVSLLQ